MIFGVKIDVKQWLKKITFKGQPLPIYSSKKVVLPQKSGKLKRAACIGMMFNCLLTVEIFLDDN
jgi:hypothetical protein